MAKKRREKTKRVRKREERVETRRTRKEEQGDGEDTGWRAGVQRVMVIASEYTTSPRKELPCVHRGEEAAVERGRGARGRLRREEPEKKGRGRGQELTWKRM